MNQTQFTLSLRVVCAQVPQSRGNTNPGHRTQPYSHLCKPNIPHTFLREHGCSLASTWAIEVCAVEV